MLKVMLSATVTTDAEGQW